ncbi:hypothetical protein BC938DRAFT_477207, partial [Jimgerdemannia flammicorona]
MIPCLALLGKWPTPSSFRSIPHYRPRTTHANLPPPIQLPKCISPKHLSKYAKTSSLSIWMPLRASETHRISYLSRRSEGRRQCSWRALRSIARWPIQTSTKTALDTRPIANFELLFPLFLPTTELWHRLCLQDFFEIRDANEAGTLMGVESWRELYLCKRGEREREKMEKAARLRDSYRKLEHEKRTRATKLLTDDVANRVLKRAVGGGGGSGWGSGWNGGDAS